MSADEPAPARAAGPGRVQRLRAGLRVLGERIVLGAVAGGATTLVLAWAGLPWRTALVAGGIGAVAVLVAAWVASTVPPVPGTPGAPGETSGGTPGEPGRSGPRRPAP
ncbi:hypothetical protein [Cellulomonas cellasea]|uniref:Uncharacterized protein n=1 Tax=Cellulomonas cellasea TaxID=43670 RepID=A0A7W4YC21_9CELL|nr:hypothetical protein [Cellulomonas cellasea]MBB2923096.1 hypothetical protein [Cellulomonas cellasea]